MNLKGFRNLLRYIIELEFLIILLTATTYVVMAAYTRCFRDFLASTTRSRISLLWYGAPCEAWTHDGHVVRSCELTTVPWHRWNSIDQSMDSVRWNPFAATTNLHSFALMSEWRHSLLIEVSDERISVNGVHALAEYFENHTGHPWRFMNLNWFMNVTYSWIFEESWIFRDSWILVESWTIRDYWWQTCLHDLLRCSGWNSVL